jgi:hypothetical protein
MPSKWTTVTISQDTLKLLQAEREFLNGLYIQGRVDLEVSERTGGQPGNGVSADTVIRMLLKFKADHRARARKSPRKASKTKTSAGASLPPADGPESQS